MSTAKNLAAEFAVAEELPLRVLIVDDNRDQADSLALLLQARGSELQVAYGAQAALERAGDFLPEAILLDLNMPETNGYELAAQLRNDSPDIVLIAITGMVDEVYRQKAKEAGFHHYFVKPVSLPQLREILEGAKAGRRGA